MDYTVYRFDFQICKMYGMMWYVYVAICSHGKNGCSVGEIGEILESGTAVGIGWIPVGSPQCPSPVWFDPRDCDELLRTSSRHFRAAFRAAPRGWKVATSSPGIADEDSGCVLKWGGSPKTTKKRQNGL